MSAKQPTRKVSARVKFKGRAPDLIASQWRIVHEISIGSMEEKHEPAYSTLGEPNLGCNVTKDV
jgi:hypothetical protein